MRTNAVLKQIESAALEAYRRDVENNADLSSIAINDKLQQDNLMIRDKPTSGKKIWKEAKSKDGATYYWNILTNGVDIHLDFKTEYFMNLLTESVWVQPAEGYLSLAEQREERDEVTRQQLKLLQKEKRIEAFMRFALDFPCFHNNLSQI